MSARKATGYSTGNQNYTYPEFVIDERSGQVAVNLVDKNSGQVVRHIPSSELNQLARNVTAAPGGEAGAQA